MTQPCYLTISQSENCAGAGHTPCQSLPHLAFKTPSLKPIGEFRFFELQLPGLMLLVLAFAINAALSFTSTQWQRIGCQMCTSKPTEAPFSSRHVLSPEHPDIQTGDVIPMSAIPLLSAETCDLLTMMSFWQIYSNVNTSVDRLGHFTWYHLYTPSSGIARLVK